MQVSIYKTAQNSDFQNLRNSYFRSLFLPQEFFLEMKIWEADVYLLKSDEQLIGYFIVQHQTLLEYHIFTKYLAFNQLIFQQIINDFSIQFVLVKSFDHLLLTNSLILSKEIKEIGYLFRDFISEEFVEETSIKNRFAQEHDFKLLASFMNNIYVDEEELKQDIEYNNMIVFENNASIVGFGIFHKTVPLYDWFDIGMAVHPDYRKNGYGTYIIRYMKNYCLERNWVPTCGCAIENLASKKTLENAGIFSKHRLYELEIN